MLDTPNPLAEVAEMAQNIDEVFKRDPRTIDPNYRRSLIAHMREERARFLAKAPRGSRKKKEEEATE